MTMDSRVADGRACSDEEWVRRIDDGVRMLVLGRTDWQRATQSQIKILCNEVNQLRFWMRTLPSLAAVFAFALGGFSAVMIAELLLRR